MKFVPSLLLVGLAGFLSIALLSNQGPGIVHADDRTGPDEKAVERTRETVKMLDDLYKNAVVSITSNYVDKQSDVPAAAVAKDVFKAMHKNGWHNARLVAATKKAKNDDNLPKTDFEKKAVAEFINGKTYIEEITTVDGKPVLRAATIVPAVMKQCAICHGGKEGRLLGAIIYELPIK